MVSLLTSLVSHSSKFEGRVMLVDGVNETFQMHFGGGSGLSVLDESVDGSSYCLMSGQ